MPNISEINVTQWGWPFGHLTMDNSVDKSLIKKLAICLAIGFTTSATIKCLAAYMRKKRRNSYKDGIVYLHQFKRAVKAPSICPYCLKLESYLRMAKIPYENVFYERPSGPTGKLPFITYNGKNVADSTICIKFLSEEFNVDLDSHLTDGQKSIGLFLQRTAEFHFSRCLALHRFVFDEEKKSIRNLLKFPKFPPFFLIWKYMKKRHQGDDLAGLPRKTVEELGRNDMESLSLYLGIKPYFLGSKPSLVDLSLFGVLANAVWNAPESKYELWINNDFINLREVCIRMKDQLWPDWDACLDPI